MAKLTREQKAIYNQLKDFYKTEKCFILNSHDKRVTVFVFRSFEKSNVIKVSTSVCSAKGKPSRKIGKYVAMIAMYHGESVSIPAAGFNACTLEDIAQMFMDFI